MNKIVKFSKVSCPNCAEKLRKSAEKLDYVDSAELDFEKGELKLCLNADGDCVADIRKIAAKLEPGAEIHTGHTHEHGGGKSLPRRFALPLIHAGLLAAALLLSGLPVAGKALIFLCFGWTAFPVARRVFEAVRNRTGIDEDFLMLTAGIGAMLIGEYYEGVAVMLLNEIGELLEELATERSRKSITETMELRPEYANVVRNNAELRVIPEEVQTGEIIIVRPGERIPLDGIVESGAASLDTAMLTGESVPRAVSEGVEVLSGCVNLDGTLHIRTSKEYSDSAVSRIMKMTDDARKHKAKTESLITRFAKYYTPGVMLAALLLCIIPILFGGNPSVWLYRGLTLLVVSCPCALVISVPMAYFAGMGGSAKRGIIARGGRALDALAQCDTFVFDKTGTLTGGVFEISEILPEAGIDAQTLLYYCASAEAGSNHPLAKCLRNAYPADPPKRVQELAGKGISAEIDGKTVLCGNLRLLEESGIPLPQSQGTTAIYCAIDGAYAGCIKMIDKLKPGAKNAVEALRRAGIRSFKVLSGDAPEAVREAASAAGIESYSGGLLPDGKLEEVARLSENGAKVAFIGDGINDAPVLTRADAGIAMGAIGADAAVEAADIVIMNDDISLVPAAFAQARRTRAMVRTNIIFALGVKAAVLILASLGLCGMWAAVIADTGVSLLAVANSARLIK